MTWGRGWSSFFAHKGLHVEGVSILWKQMLNTLGAPAELSVCVMVVVSLLLWSLRGTLAGVHSLSLSFHVHLVSLIYIGCSTGKRCVFRYCLRTYILKQLKPSF